MHSDSVPITRCEAFAYKIPTDQPESDGTLEWDSTTMVVALIQAGDKEGLGYTFSDAAAAKLIRDKLAPLLVEQDAMANGARHAALVREIRNLGRPGLIATAISAVDVALWDLKAKLLQLSLTKLFDSHRSAVPIYGSGGFTSYDQSRLQNQLAAFVQQGISRIKMKVGRHPAVDAARLAAAREAVGPDVALMVDGNGAYDRKHALQAAEMFARYGVDWFEEPVSSDDLEGLNMIAQRAPAGMEVTAGEYGYDIFYFRRMLEAQSVDVLQADATRCLGYTGFLKAAALCEAFNIPLSAHTAPHLHVPCCCAAKPLRHVEYFYDHVRIAGLLLDGASEPKDGWLAADESRPGHGLELKRADAEKYAQSLR